MFNNKWTKKQLAAILVEGSALYNKAVETAESMAKSGKIWHSCEFFNINQKDEWRIRPQFRHMLNA